jgi:hypothetical protein
MVLLMCTYSLLFKKFKTERSATFKYKIFLIKGPQLLKYGPRPRLRTRVSLETRGYAQTGA